MDYGRHVQEYTARTGKTRFVIATWHEDANQWQAPMNGEARKLTGCHTSFAKRLEDIDKTNCYTYASRRDALRCATKLANSG